MKSRRDPLRLLSSLCAWLLFAPQGMNSQLAPLKLEADHRSNQMTLHWPGALGIKLQQTTNLTNASWVDVPGSDGLNHLQLPMTNPIAAFRLVAAERFRFPDHAGS